MILRRLRIILMDLLFFSFLSSCQHHIVLEESSHQPPPSLTAEKNLHQENDSVPFSIQKIPLDGILTDQNISALYAEGNDLWIGTWNGGFIRYSLLRGEALVLKQSSQSIAPLTVRSIAAQGLSLWVGTYSGLYQFWKPREEWTTLSTQGKFKTERIQDISSRGNEVYIATLGWGLWRLQDRELTRIPTRHGKRGQGPGEFITLLHWDEEEDLLYAGTMDKGLWKVSQDEYSAWSEGGQKDLKWEPLIGSPRNITVLIQDNSGLWVGSYGEGLACFLRREQAWQRYTHQEGHITNDWILSGQGTRDYLFWGTFGGGLNVYHKESKTWYSLGLEEGVPGLDVSTLYFDQAGKIYMGTLGRGVAVLEVKNRKNVLSHH